MTKLIVNADDFGYSKGVNFGIIESFKNGIVTSATLMANMPGREHAAQLAKEHPELGVGIHLVLTCGSPVRRDVSSLVNDRGEFRSRGDLMQYAQPQDIEREFSGQIEAFFSLGLTPTHLDSHHHVHSHEAVTPIVAHLAKKYGLPVRKVSNDPAHAAHPELQTIDLFLHDFYGENVSKEYLLRLLDQARGCGTVEMMCHPAYVDVGLLNGSSYTLQRVRELEILTDPEIASAVREREFELISYREWEHAMFLRKERTR